MTEDYVDPEEQEPLITPWLRRRMRDRERAGQMSYLGNCVLKLTVIAAVVLAAAWISSHFPYISSWIGQRLTAAGL